MNNEFTLSYEVFKYFDFTITISYNAFQCYSFRVSRLIHGKEFKLYTDQGIYRHPDLALLMGIGYTSKHEKALKERFKASFIEFCEEVASNSKFFYLERPEIDTLYFIKARIALKKREKEAIDAASLTSGTTEPQPTQQQL